MTRAAAVLGVLLLAASLAGPAAAGPDPVGWERVEQVPDWVVAPPRSEGTLRVVDVGVSNQLDLAYDVERVPREFLRLRWWIEKRLRPVLGADACAPALAGARAAAVVRTAFHHVDAGSGDAVVGGAVYTAFVLWETPLDTVLGVLPEVWRGKARAALTAPDTSPPWATVDGRPAWADDLPVKEGVFYAVSRESSSRPDVAQAVAALRAEDQLRWEIHARLGFPLGPDAATDVAWTAVTEATLKQRAVFPDAATAWTLWEVPVDEVLDAVPERSRAAAREALAGPVPPRPWTWIAVDAEPSWVADPPRWPRHVAVVLTIDAADPAAARKDAIGKAEDLVRARLASRLEPVLGGEAAAAAARAGARARVHGRHAFLDRGEGAAEPRVTAFSLWQVPVDAVVEQLPAAQRADVRAALTR